MDAIVYLMENGIAAEKISWVISRDSWVIDRATTQNTEAFLSAVLETKPINLRHWQKRPRSKIYFIA